MENFFIKIRRIILKDEEINSRNVGDKMNQEQRKKKRVRKKKIRLALVGFVFIYLLLRSIPSLGYKTKLPEKYTVYDKIETQAIIIKDEKIYAADGEGQLKIYGKEGSKIPVGEKVAEIALLSDTSTLENKLEEIDEKIEVLSEAEGKNISPDSDVKQLENNVNAIVEEIQESIYSGDYSKAILLKDKLLMNYGKQKDILGDNTLLDHSLESLKEQRENIVNQINNNIISYYSKESGILSFKIDGYEERFTDSNKENYNYSDFENITDKKETVSNSRNVKVGEPIFKIINNFEWHMLIKIDDSKRIKDYKEGGSITLSGGHIKGELRGRIIKINVNGSKGTILCRFDRDFHYYYDKRIIDVGIILGKYESYKVPKKVITELEGVKGVYIKDISGIVKFRPVEILKEEEDYVYISPGDKNGKINLGKKEELVKTVSQFDEILLNPEKVEEGMIIN